MSSTSLRAYLRSFFPDYLVPSKFIFLKSLPMNPNGKLDRNALKAFQPEETESDDIFSFPETTIEQKLVAFWRHLLKIEHVRVSDSFFDLGGDSLAALSLFCWVEKEYGKRIAVSTIYKWPTIAQLAPIISGCPESNPASCMIPFRTKGSGPPLFLIPNILGSMLIYHQLLKYLYRDQIVCGIELSVNDLKKPIGDVAVYYADQIRKAFPSSPYCLIGYSSGGILALEIARRFGEMNCKVPFLAMIDTLYPVSSKSQLQPLEKVVRTLSSKNLIYWLCYAFPFWISYHIGEMRDRNLRGYNREVQNNVLMVSDWLKRYAPEPYSERILFFKAKAQGLFKTSLSKRWETICSAFDIYVVPGYHSTMMTEPHVKYLAEKINLELRKSTASFPDDSKR